MLHYDAGRSAIPPRGHDDASESIESPRATKVGYFLPQWHRHTAELPPKLLLCILRNVHSSSDLINVCLASASMRVVALDVLFEHVKLQSSKAVGQFCESLSKQKGLASRVLSLELSLMDEDYGRNAILFLFNLKTALSLMRNVRKLSIFAPGFPGSYLPDCPLPRLVNFTTNFVSFQHVEFLERHRNQIKTLSLAAPSPDFRRKLDLEAIRSLPHFPELKTITCCVIMVSGIAYACNASIEEMIIRWNERVIAAKIFRRISGTNIRALTLELSHNAWKKTLFFDLVREIPDLWALQVSISSNNEMRHSSMSVLNALYESLADFEYLEFLCISDGASTLEGVGNQCLTSEELDEEFQDEVQKWVERCPTLRTVQVVSGTVWRVWKGTEFKFWLPTTRTSGSDVRWLKKNLYAMYHDDFVGFVSDLQNVRYETANSETGRLIHKLSPCRLHSLLRAVDEVSTNREKM